MNSSTQALYSLTLFSYTSLVLVTLLLVIFVLHSLFVWGKEDPEVAYDRAATLVETTEVAWDTFIVLANALIDMVNSVIIPAWNAGVFYVVEPSVMLVIEAFSVIFAGESYKGVVSASDYPFKGIDCMKTAEAQRFCGRYGAYEELLKKHEAGFVNKSQVFLGLHSARRLSELTGVFEPPVFDLDLVSGVLTDILTLAVTSLAPLADVMASVVDDVIETSARTIFDAVWNLAENLIMTLKMVVKSGLLPFIVAVGVDFLVIYYVYYALPMFLATIDFINCMMQMVMPSTWPEQLRCAEIKCFTGPEAASDLLIFTSYSRYAGYLADALEALSNGATARGFGKGDSTGMIGSFLGNSVFGALDTIREFAEMADVPASAEECEACFNCKVCPPASAPSHPLLNYQISRSRSRTLS